MLQPHEGASGTWLVRKGVSLLAGLQPHEGASGTPDLTADVSNSKLQPHEGASGTTGVVGRPAHPVLASTPRGCIWNNRSSNCPKALMLQPHEGASGTTATPTRTRISPCFNPTRVHLELEGLGVVLEDLPASTPRGCIWNWTAPSPRTESCRFNPTRVHLERYSRLIVSTLPCFNPTRVHLERYRSAAFRSASDPLQPHEGASGTYPRRRAPRAARPASTPRGCIWNVASYCSRRQHEEASTPRGCIWNSVGNRLWCRDLPASTPRGCIWNPALLPPSRPRRRFNPTRVHLEHIRDCGMDFFEVASTPRGCIWNDPAVRLVGIGELLQPHEGASGTLRHHASPSGGVVASTPRGCIWNPGTGASCPVLLLASTPRGCIWNLLDVPSAEAICSSFNPTRVHLEPRTRTGVGPSG